MHKFTAIITSNFWSFSAHATNACFIVILLTLSLKWSDVQVTSGFGCDAGAQWQHNNLNADKEGNRIEDKHLTSSVSISIRLNLSPRK